MLYKKQLTKEQAKEKIKHFCVYQERSHNEVRAKLVAYGLKVHEINEIVCLMIEENYLNEERFASHFAGGKFRIKKWGRIKIRYELRQKGIGDYIIKASLKQIDEAEYRQALLKLAQRKMAELKHETPLNRLAKSNVYLLQKGYEPALVAETLQNLNRPENALQK